MSPQAALLTAPIAPTLARMAAPNVVAMFVMLATSMTEVWYVGQLGTGALAGLALAFPMMMLTMMLSAGSMGGAISGAVAQRLGAGDRAGAEALALHAVVPSIALALLFSGLFLGGGRAIYGALGGQGAVLAHALAYSDVLFIGCISIWLANTLSSVIRATGHMKVAAAGMITASVVQIACAGVLVFGLGPFPKMGIAGAALASVIGFACGAILQLYYLMARCQELRLSFTGMRLRLGHFSSLLKVGALASISPLASVATVIVITGYVARLGIDVLAGYGIGSRLEFLMIPLIFGIGAASITMVGVHFGAGEYRRGLRVAWTAAFASAVLTGLVGGTLALFPGLWADLFTDSAAVRETCRAYLRIVGPYYAFFGLGLCLFFASQGARRMLWPVLASLLRLAVVVLGGIAIMASAAPTAEMLFMLIAAAMALYAVVMAAAIRLGAWTSGLEKLTPAPGLAR